MKKLLMLIISLLMADQAFSQDSFEGIFDSTFNVAETEKSVLLYGEFGFDYWSYLDNNWNSERIIRPYADLGLFLASGAMEARVDLTINAEDLDTELTIGDLVEEIWLRTFFSFGYLDLGLFKVEWGKGDGIHVIDPLNPLDNSEGISPDINDMKKSEIMTRMNFYLLDRGLLELVYKPYFHPIETAIGSRWAVKELPFPLDLQTIPDTEIPAYSQAAARITATIGIFDLGAMYYYGFMQETGYEITYTDPFDFNTYKTKLNYTRAQLFGVEAGWALGSFTFRTEGGYWFTEDRNGTEAHLYNDRAVWLAGFDILIPGTPLFISVQEFGSYVINFDISNPADVDFGMSYNDSAFTNTLITALEGSFYNERMKLRIAGLFLFEANGYMLMPTYSWFIEDDLELSVAGQFFGGDNEGSNPYYSWENNDSLTLSLKYIF